MRQFLRKYTINYCLYSLSTQSLLELLLILPRCTPNTLYNKAIRLHALETRFKGCFAEKVFYDVDKVLPFDWRPLNCLADPDSWRSGGSTIGVLMAIE